MNRGPKHTGVAFACRFLPLGVFSMPHSSVALLRCANFNRTFEGSVPVDPSPYLRARASTLMLACPTHPAPAPTPPAASFDTGLLLLRATSGRSCGVFLCLALHFIRTARLVSTIVGAGVKLGRVRVPLPLTGRVGHLEFTYQDSDIRVTRGNRWAPWDSCFPPPVCYWIFGSRRSRRTFLSCLPESGLSIAASPAL